VEAALACGGEAADGFVIGFPMGELLAGEAETLLENLSEDVVAEEEVGDGLGGGELEE
jgi:hypothetical protein